MADELDKHEAERGKGDISRRAALRRAGGVGLMATMGMGFMEALGASRASAKQSTQADTRLGSRAAAPNSGPGPCCTTAYLAKGHCGRPCPPGYWCYQIFSCDPRYLCMVSSGQPTLRFCA